MQICTKSRHNKYKNEISSILNDPIDKILAIYSDHPSITSTIHPIRNSEVWIRNIKDSWS